MVFPTDHRQPPLFESTRSVSGYVKLDNTWQQRTEPRLHVLRVACTQMIDRLLAFLEVDADTMASAEILSRLLAPRLDQIIDEFYGHVRSYDVNASITDDMIPTLKRRQKQHWLALFDSRFGPDYCASARRIAIRHRDIDLNPLWYVAGYTHLKLAYIEVIMTSDFGPITKRKLVEALEKYIAIDMALALSTYDAVVLP